MPIDWTKGTDSENVLELSTEQRAIWDEIFVCLTEIEAIIHKDAFLIRKNQASPLEETTVAAYLLSQICDYNNPFSIEFSDLEIVGIDPDILDFAKNHGISNYWAELLRLLPKHEKLIFKLASGAVSKNDSDPNYTPDCLIELSTALLKIKNGEQFCDLCCGTGSVALNVKSDSPEAVVSGYDSNAEKIAVAKVYCAAREKQISFNRRDVFELAQSDEKVLFQKIFANYPFGMRIKDLGTGKDYLNQLSKRIPSFSRATSSDWLYNMLMVDLLEEGGKAVGIMTNGGTWNTIDAPIRKYFVESGFVECVIALPGKLFYGTNVQTSLIILSHGNESVRLVDATEWVQLGRRDNTLSAEDVAQIVAATKEDGDKSRLLSVEELRENDYVLNIKRYIDGSAFVQNGIEFGELITRIGRGLQLNAKDLDDLSSATPTDLQYLSLSSIQNGIIEKALPHIENIVENSPKFERYFLKNRSLVLSKNGFPYKVAVAEIEEDQNILACGNLYIIELDREKVNPYYLAAYFSSEQGSAALKAISVGASLPNIGVEQLRKMRVPLPSIEHQNKVAEKYLSARDEIEMLQLKLEKAKNRMAEAFEEEGE